MAPHNPILSVVMSVYNGEAFLREAVDSVLGQTFGDFEFIIIDDGSTDQTPQILCDYAKREPRVRVFHQRNQGRAEALNSGVDLATAPLIARMDADDVSFPQRFEQQVEFMRTRPEVGLLGAAVDIIAQDGRKIGAHQPPFEDATLRATLLRHNPFRHPTLMMRKEAVLAVNGYRKALLDVDDYDLILRMAERTRMANLRECVLSYRVHPNQASVVNIKHQALCGFAARVAASFRKQGLPDPLCGVEKITPQFVRELGVSDEEIRRDTAGAYLYWIGLLAEVYPDSTLTLVDSLLDLSKSGSIERSATAVALLRAAGIHFRRGRLTKGLASVGRSVLAQPIEVGRHLKMAVTRRAMTVSRP